MAEPYQSISEQAYFSAPQADRHAVRSAFVKHADGITTATPPYHRFDIERSHKRGLRRLERTRQDILENIYTTRALINQHGLSEVESQMFYDKNQENLIRIKLVEHAREIQSDPTPSAKTAYKRLNRKLYGDVDTNLFWGIVADKRQMLHDFKPQPDDDAAQDTQHWLISLPLFQTAHRGFKFDDPQLIRDLGKLVRQKYAPIFKIIPGDAKQIYRAHDAKPLLAEAMSTLGFHTWRVTVSEQVVTVNSNSTKHRLQLPSDFVRSAPDLRRLAVHEIGVHAARSVNGASSQVPILEYGTAGYLRAEEGLASLLECAAEGEINAKSLRRLVYRYLTAGLATGVDGRRRNAEEVYQIIAPLLIIEHLVAEPNRRSAEIAEQATAEAYTYIENAFRGTGWTTRGLAYLKLKIYYEGLIDNLRYFADNRQNLSQALDLALIGKYNHTDLEEAKNIALAVELHQ